jgi:hypothetical protein
MAVAKKNTQASASPAISWPFGKRNYILLALALAVIAIGYVCLGYGDDPNHPITLTLAPILLVIGYAIIPFAIMAKGRSEGSKSGADKPESN